MVEQPVVRVFTFMYPYIDVRNYRVHAVEDDWSAMTQPLVDSL